MIAGLVAQGKLKVVAAHYDIANRRRSASSGSGRPTSPRLRPLQGIRTRYSTLPWRCIGPVGFGTPGAGSSVTAKAS